MLQQDSPLHWAANNGHHEIVSVLLAAGADVNARDNVQCSPLHQAAWNGHHETVSVLLTAGADVNARSEREDTPLHYAARWGYTKCAEILLQHGADTGLRNKHGLTSKDIAADEDTSDAEPDNEDEEERITRGRKEILKLLRQQNNGVSTRKKEYDPVLVRFYEENGMTEARKDHPLIQEAAKESGKTLDQVMNFIGNYRKIKGGSKRRPPPDTMERKRRITGYHEYYREQLPRKRANRGFSLAGANKEIGESWKNLTDEEKEGYNKAAERRRGKETKVKTSSEVGKKLRQLEKLSEELGELGVEALMVTLYNGRIRSFGSQKNLIKDEKFGGYIENQLKAAEHQRKAAQCLTMDRRRKNSGREGATGTTGENHDVTGRSGSSTSSVSKRRKKTKEAEQGKQQHPSSTASLPSASSTQGSTTVTTGGLPHTAPQIPTAASLGTSVPSQVTPTVRQAPTGVRATNGQFPHSPLVFAMPHHR